MEGLLPIITHGGAAGIGALVLYGLGMVLRDGQHARVTAARRDESLAPALIEDLRENQREARIENAELRREIAEVRAEGRATEVQWRAAEAELRAEAEASRRAERECTERLARVSQRLSAVEARCGECPGRVAD